MYVCIYVCMYVSRYVYLSLSLSLPLSLYVYIYVYICKKHSVCIVRIFASNCMHGQHDVCVFEKVPTSNHMCVPSQRRIHHAACVYTCMGVPSQRRKHVV